MCTKIEDEPSFNLILDFMYVRKDEYVPLLTCLKPLGEEYFKLIAEKSIDYSKHKYPDINFKDFKEAVSGFVTNPKKA